MEKNFKYPYIRYWFAIAGFLGLSLNFAIRVNLSVAIVAMVNTSAIDYHDENTTTLQHCKPSAEDFNSSSVISVPHMEGEFAWFPQEQENILGSFFYGYPILQIPGGRLSEMYSGKWMFGIATFAQVFLVLLTPLAARFHVALLITFRALEGMAQGVALSALYNLMSHWIPDSEREVITGFIFSGFSAGTVAGMTATGYICNSVYFGGWPSSFYAIGLFGCVWFVLWCLLITNTPYSHPFITDKELQHITLNQNKDKNAKLQNFNWRKVMTSLPVWAIIIAHVGGDWGYFLMETNLPTFFSTILGFDIKKSAFFSSLPFIVKAFVWIFAGYLSDILLRKNFANVRFIRIFSTVMSHLLPALCLMGVYFADCDVTLSVTCLMGFVIFYGFNGCGMTLNPLDLSPEYAGTIIGLVNTITSVVGILSPWMVGALTDQNQTMEQWKIVFVVSAAFQALSGLFFIFFFSVEKQNFS